jgi:hypothetical protein
VQDLPDAPSHTDGVGDAGPCCAVRSNLFNGVTGDGVLISYEFYQNLHATYVA